MNGLCIVVASGKGGTGKTTFSVNLAYALSRRGKTVRLLDCDVEEPNDHLFVKPEFSNNRDVEVLKPVWDENRCVGCGECVQACNFNALALVKDTILIFDELCHGCGACSYVCPHGALTERESSIGVVQIDPDHGSFYFAHGVLSIGQTLAPTVVKAVKEHTDSAAINIIDASPGAACPVTAALQGADIAVLVTEPTPFGLNDLKIAVSMTLEMGIRTGIVVNRSDGVDTLIRAYAKEVDVPIIGTIPFNRSYAESYSAGRILVDEHPEFECTLLDIYEEIKQLEDRPLPKAPQNEQPVTLESDEEAGAEADEGATRIHTAEIPEIAIISGKGGTGKTTVAAAFACFQRNGVLADTDVDASDLHLLLNPHVRETHSFIGGNLANVDPAKCTACGTCATVCRFDAFTLDGPGNSVAVTTFRVDPVACEGCRYCALVCPEHAITTGTRFIGNWYVSTTDFGSLVHARLGIGEENSGRLATQVRTHTTALAQACNTERVLIDGPPGTGCPVIASVTGVHLILIVTEPTVSGVHDMKRVLDLASQLGVTALVMINKADLNLEQARKIEAIASEHGSKVIARIPFDRAVHEALMVGKTIGLEVEGVAAGALADAWVEVKRAVADLTNDPIIHNQTDSEKKFANRTT